MKYNLDDEVHISRDGNGIDTYEPYLLTASRDAQGPIFMGILSGENVRGVKLLPIVSDTNNSIKIKNSTNTTPLILTSTYSMVKFNIIPCSINPKNNFKIKIVKKMQLYKS